MAAGLLAVRKDQKDKADAAEAKSLGISVTDLRSMRETAVTDPKGVQRLDKPGNPKGAVPTGGEDTVLGDGGDRKRRRRAAMTTTVLSDAVGGTRLGA
jgi:hypothetical protein